MHAQVESIIILLMYNACMQERIMRKEGRGEECDTTMHLIVLLKLACMNFVHTDSYSRSQSLWGLYDPSVGSSLPKPPRSPAETKRKAFDYVQVFEYSAAKWNWWCMTQLTLTWPLSCCSRIDRQHFSVDKRSFENLIHAYNKVQA